MTERIPGMAAGAWNKSSLKEMLQEVARECRTDVTVWTLNELLCDYLAYLEPDLQPRIAQYGESPIAQIFDEEDAVLEQRMWDDSQAICFQAWAYDAIRRWAAGEDNDDEIEAIRLASLENYAAPTVRAVEFIVLLIQHHMVYRLSIELERRDAQMDRETTVVQYYRCIEGEHLQCREALRLIMPLHPYEQDYRIVKGTLVGMGTVLEMPEDIQVEWDMLNGALDSI